MTSQSESSHTMRLAYVTQWFDTEQETPIATSIAAEMRRRGMAVRVASAPPPGYFGRRRVNPRARRWQPWREEVEGFDVLRSPCYQTRAPSAIKRTLSVAAFALSSSWFGLGMVRNADAVLVYASPGPAAMPAVVGRLLRGAPYVLLVQDLWPDSITSSGYLTGPAARRVVDATVGRLMKFAYRHSAAVLAITPGMHEELVARGVDPDKVHLLYNWVDESLFSPVPENDRLRSTIGAGPDDVVLVYAGNHGRPQGLWAWVEAMLQVPTDTKVRLVFIGSGVTRDELIERAAGDPRIHFLPATPASDVASMTADADAMVISLVDEPAFRISLPSKLQTCLALGKAVLNSAPGETAGVVRTCGAGWSCPPDDPAAIARIIEQAAAAGREGLRERGSLGLAYYRKNMSSRSGAERLGTIIESATARATSSPVAQSAP